MAKRYSTWKNYKRTRKKFVPIHVGDRFRKLTVIEVQPQKKGKYAVIVCKCECSHVIKTSSQSLRKGFILACDACTVFDRKYAKEIAAAKELERRTRLHIDPSELPKREPWRWIGDEDSLIQEQEKQDA